jgi:hypothetical protein
MEWEVETGVQCARSHAKGPMPLTLQPRYCAVQWKLLHRE